MPPHRTAQSLLDNCLKQVERLVAEIALSAAIRITDAIDRLDSSELADGETISEYSKNLSVDAASSTRELLFSYIVHFLHEEVTLSILRGLEFAVQVKKELLKKVESDTTRSSRHSREMVVIVIFSELVISRRLRTLDLNEVPKILRAHLFDKLDHFKSLQVLKLGSGSGGWSDMYIEKFLVGVRCMRFLTYFSLCYDCNDDILNSLTKNCSKTLRVIDVEMSRRVTDTGAKYLGRCKNLLKLHIFHSGMTTEGHVILLKQLKKLRVLVRGDFLCEALEYIEQEGSSVSLELEEFWSSEEYFFHDLHQMNLVAQACPKLKKMMFQFSKDVMRDLLFLADFTLLTELHLWGGEFYSDKINLALTQIGVQLNVLYLIHTEEIDLKAIILISHVCPNLNTLGFYNCELKQREQSDDSDIIRDPIHREEKMEKLLEVKMLAIVSECSELFLIPLLSSVLNVEHVKTGINCEIRDSTISTILANNSLQHLQTVDIPSSAELTKHSIDNLLLSCPKLSCIRDLNYWKLIDRDEVDDYIDWRDQNNYDLDLGVRAVEPEEQKYLDNLPSTVIQYLMGREMDT